MKKILIALAVVWLMLAVSGPVQAAPAISSTAAVLIDADSGQVLYSQNTTQTFYAGGFVKLVNAYTAIIHSSLSDNATTTYTAISGLNVNHTLGLVSGEQINIEDAIFATLLGETTDTGCVVAETIGKTIRKYVTLMNTEAAYLSAGNFTITTGAGTPSETQVATVIDIAAVTMNALKNEDFYRIFTAGTHTIPATNMHGGEREVCSQHDMVNGTIAYKGVKGGMNAFSNTDGYHLMTYAEKNGRNLICVVMGGEERETAYNDTKLLLDYGYQEWQNAMITSKELQAKLPNAVRGLKIIFNDEPEAGYKYLVPKTENKHSLDYVYDCALDENVYLHGTLTLRLSNSGYQDNALLSVTFYDAGKADNVGKIIQHIVLILLILLALLALLLLMRKYRKYRRLKYTGVPPRPKSSSLRMRKFRAKAAKFLLPQKEWNYLDYHQDLNDRDWYNYYRYRTKRENYETGPVLQREIAAHEQRPPENIHSNRQLYQQSQHRKRNKNRYPRNRYH